MITTFLGKQKDSLRRSRSYALIFERVISPSCSSSGCTVSWCRGEIKGLGTKQKIRLANCSQLPYHFHEKIYHDFDHSLLFKDSCSLRVSTLAIISCYNLSKQCLSFKMGGLTKSSNLRGRNRRRRFLLSLESWRGGSHWSWLRPWAKEKSDLKRAKEAVCIETT